ncbi:hypothetical protein YC2023_118049 [Brassica napus]
MLFKREKNLQLFERSTFENQHDEIEAKILEERAALEAKYQKLYQPFYTKRYEIVTGAVEVDGAPEEVKIEQGENKAAEGVLSITFTKSWL